MIYTVTFNPALDYVIKVDKFETGIVNRVFQENIFFGGKGINVSVVLRELGFDSVALGFTAGFTGKALEDGIKAQGITSDFIHLENGMTRINVKMKSDNETEINGMGPDISKEAIDELFAKLDKLVQGDVLALSGSIPQTLPEDIYEQIMERLQDRGVLIAVDATKDLLLNVLKYHPFLIKPNNHELGEMFHVVLESDEDIIYYAKELQKQGARNVLISMAGDGAILVTETNEVVKMGVPKGVIKNSVGAGDSMVAGFLAGYLKTGSYHEALKLGTASGSATAFSEGLAKRAYIDELLETL